MRLVSSFALLFLFLFAACGSGGQVQLDPDAFAAALQKEKATVQLVDVRTPEEFQSGRLEGALNINFYDADFAQKMAKLDREKPLLIYCAVGGRSGKAAEQMTAMGFKNVVNLTGGIQAWRAKGKPVVQ